MHALTDTTLAETAASVFSFQEIDTHRAVIIDSATVADKQKACMTLCISRSALPSVMRDELCDHLIEWYTAHLPEAERLSDAPHILRSLNQCLSAIGCQPVSESMREIYGDARENLHQALLERAVGEIKKAQSGCLMDMHVRSFISALPQLGMRLNEEAKSILSDAVNAAPLTHEAAEWKDSCSYTLDRNVHRKAKAAALNPA